MVNRKLLQVRHLSLEFYKAGVEIGVSQHLGLFLSLNGRKSNFKKLNLTCFASEWEGYCSKNVSIQRQPG